MHVTIQLFNVQKKTYMNVMLHEQVPGIRYMFIKCISLLPGIYYVFIQCISTVLKPCQALLHQDLCQLFPLVPCLAVTRADRRVI